MTYTVLTIFMAGLLCMLSPSFVCAEDTGRELRVALLPIIDALPFFVAEDEGYFKAKGLSVRAIPVASGLERDQLMQAGAIDGMLNEMTTTAAFNRNEVLVKIVGMCRASQEGSPLFRILASPGSGMKDPADLSGIPIGVSKGTIIEYVTDRLLTGRGLSPSRIITRSVPSIPERFQLLMQGQLKAVTLPDPLGKSALDAGAVEVLNDTVNPDLSVSVLSFSSKSLSLKEEAISLFLKAWNMASEKINENPEACRKLMLSKIRVPENVQATYMVPPFSVNRVPDEAQWDDVMEWMTGKGLLDKTLQYEGSVSTMFLP